VNRKRIEEQAGDKDACGEEKKRAALKPPVFLFDDYYL